MKQYLELLREVRERGIPKQDRTGTGTLSLFGRQLRFDLADGFPAVTTKKLQLRSVIYELLWFLRGESSLAWLHEHDVGIWDEWADANGELGPIYGVQWRSWPTADGREIDQLQRTIEQIRSEPDSRRLLVSAWNVGELDKMALMPCHVLFQFWVADGRISLQVYQRSADVFLGLPFNIASYALLLGMVAQVTEHRRGELVYVLGDVHLYRNHVEQADRQLAREPYPPPKLVLNPARKSLAEFCYEDFVLEGYRSHRGILAPIAV